MKCRALSIICVVLMSYAASTGQTTYRGLTPGQSTRSDVERIFGSPVKNVSKTLIEYTSPEAETKLYVQYRDETPAAVVERIELTCANVACDLVYEKARQSVRYVEFDARVNEPVRKAYDDTIPLYPMKVTVYFGAPRFLRLLEHKKAEGEGERKVAYFSPTLYEDTAPQGGCTGSIFGKWETQTLPGYGDASILGLVTIERVGNDGIKGAYRMNNGTLTLKRAWENDQNFQYGHVKYKGEWKDDTGAGTIEIKVESYNDFRSAEAKLTRTSGTSKTPGVSKNPKAGTRGAIIGAILGAGPSWRGNCVP